MLVDRLWPRGLSKEQVRADLWLPNIAPSTELRKWFGHDPARWEEFKRRYWKELQQKQAILDQLREIVARQPLTLLYAVRDQEHNQAVALKEFLERSLRC